MHTARFQETPMLGTQHTNDSTLLITISLLMSSQVLFSALMLLDYVRL